MKSSLRKDEDVTLVGFGTFYAGKRAARTGRNPRTGEALDIKAARLPKFRAGDMAAGITAGVDDVIKVLTGDAATFKQRAAERQKSYDADRPDDRSGFSLSGIIFIVIILIVLWRMGWWPLLFMGGGRGGGWSGGSSGGSWGGSSGGFSGGGGSFGGGGSSGRW